MPLMAGPRILAAVLGACAIGQACCQPLPAATPEERRLSAARISLLGGELRRRVAIREMPGAVLMIVRDGQVATHEAIGYQDRGKSLPMRPDTIFWIASMTKPIVSAAVMMLVEDGRLRLDDPASKYLAEFSDLKVGIERRPAQREMTIADLLRHTAGLTYGQHHSPIDELFDRTGVLSRNQTLAEMVGKLARLPLKHQPGTTWEYSVATDVLGRIIEIASGSALDEFIRTRITEPLGMRNTGFRRGGARPKFLSGGGGMVSTAMDYARFCQFLLNGGELEGRRLLSPASVAQMTTNQLPEGIVIPDEVHRFWGELSPGPQAGMGFGFGFAVRLRAQTSGLFPGSRGEFWWLGSGGSHFVVAPEERTITILLVNQPDQMRNYLLLTRQMLNGAIVK